MLIVLSREKIKTGEIAVYFVSRQRIRALNLRYLHHNYATDVIAFDLSLPGSKSKRQSLTGDIFVSTDAAVQNAKTFGTSVAHELFLYVVHGVLHFLGYDDHKAADVPRIRKKEQMVLKFIGNRVKRIVL